MVIRNIFQNKKVTYVKYVKSNAMKKLVFLKYNQRDSNRKITLFISYIIIVVIDNLKQFRRCKPCCLQ